MCEYYEQKKNKMPANLHFLVRTDKISAAEGNSDTPKSAVVPSTKILARFSLRYVSKLCWLQTGALRSDGEHCD